MSALARYFNAMGKNVSGYDKTKTQLTDELMKEGMDVHFEDNIGLIKSEVRSQKSDALVVLTPAIPKDHSELNFFQKNDCKYFLLLFLEVLNNTMVCLLF